MTFAKGQSGNPNGRPKKATVADLRDLARSKCPEMLDVLVKIALDEEKAAAARVTAASAVIDRGYGRPPQSLADPDGNPISWMDFLLGARTRALSEQAETVQ